MESKDILPPLPSSDDDAALLPIVSTSSSQPSSINRSRKRKITEPEKIPKHKLNPNDPNLSENERQSVKKSIRCRERREKEAELLKKLKEENDELKKRNQLIPQLIAEKEYLASVVFWQAAHNKGLVKHMMEMHERQFVLSGDEDSLTNYLWDERPFSGGTQNETT